MATNTDSSNNTAVGYLSLTNMDGGNGANTAVGNLAMLANTTAATNTAVGDNASRLNQTGEDNTAVGRMALYSNTTHRNTAVGLEAGYTTTGADNTYVGYRSGKGASGAEANNVGVGSNSLLAVTTGSGNVAVGKSALDSVTTSSNNTAVGLNALHACGDSYNNVAIGKDAGDTITNSGGLNTVIGTSADVSTGAAENQIVIGNGVTGTGNNEVALGNTNISAIKAQVASITAYSSDERTKKNVEDYDLKGVDFIKELNLKTYVYKNPADFPDEIRDSKWDEDGVERLEDPTETQVGLIAQEVESALAKHGVGNTETYAPTQDNGIKTLTYGNLIFPLIKAVQELSARVEELEKK